MAETFCAHRAWEQRFSDGVFCSDEPEEPERTRPACRQGCRGGAGHPRLCKRDRRARRDRVADAGKVEQWRRGQIDYLERVVQSNLPRISEAMKLFRSWAT